MATESSKERKARAPKESEHAGDESPAESTRVQRLPLLQNEQSVTTKVPARLDQLPWSNWHVLVVIALGVTWLLDGLEVTIVGVLGAVLQDPLTLNLSAFQIGLVGTSYILGAVCGSLIFGFISDRVGRKKMYMVTPSIYLSATLLCAFTSSFWTLSLLRFVTGMGIGGEYAAMNSAIQELIPARVRGSVSLLINGSFWLGAAAGAGISLVLLNPVFFPIDWGWRLSFGLGAVLGIIILVLRRYLPESPRWLLTHGRVAEAEAIVKEIETQVYGPGVAVPEPDRSLVIHQRTDVSIREIASLLFVTYPKRAFLGLVLMVAQAFFYNAIFFTYAAVLHIFYGVPQDVVGLYLLPFAVGNFLGPVILGPLFDRWGRKLMICSTYTLSAVLLLVSGQLFIEGKLTAVTQTMMWSLIFFFSSPAASAAYLTVSEIFPMEIRALAIAVFYSIGTGIGGLSGPSLFGILLERSQEDKDPNHLNTGYIVGSSLMIFAAVVEAFLGINAEGKSLEDIAQPLSSDGIVVDHLKSVQETFGSDHEDSEDDFVLSARDFEQQAWSNAPRVKPNKVVPSEEKSVVIG